MANDGVEMQEQKPEAEREAQHDADRHVALRQPLAHQPHADARRDRDRDEAGERRDAEEHGTRGPGEAHMGERMPGEGLPAQHEKVADQPGHDRDDGGRRESVPHEVVVKHGGRARHAPCRSRPTSRRCAP